MTTKYPGGFITKSLAAPTTSAASGMWTLDQATQYKQAGTWPIAGNFLAVEDVFSTYLYTGNGSTQTITNGIDLAGKGGLVWVKDRGDGASFHALYDTARGVSNRLSSNATNAQSFVPGVNSFNSNGFGLGLTYNASGNNFASWTFREAPKFFDVVTWTGNGVAGRQIAHSLGVAPGCIIVKRTDIADNWYVYHTGLSTPASRALILNTTQGISITSVWNDTAPTATNFTVAASDPVNASGGTYVAYLFAHDATADGIIQCGSYTGNGNASVQSINLGWEPQWILLKQSVVAGGSAGTTDAWQIVDNMRGLSVGRDDAILCPNNSNAENTNAFAMIAEPTATGWTVGSQANYSGATYIYIAIRRGPMKTPTVGTSVFSPNVSAAAAGTTITTNFPIDTQIIGLRGGGYAPNQQTTADRLRGVSSTTADNLTMLATASTNGESSYTNIAASRGWNNTGFQTTATYGTSSSVYWNFRRAPGFFDVVCWTGTGSYEPRQHNLQAVPELVIQKARTSISGGNDWFVNTASQYGYLNLTNGFVNFSRLLTATTFQPVADGSGNWVTYLFASCPGVSKVGSYTGNGSSQTINCGFSGGARFFLVKRTDSTGDWWVWDSARGITAPADPALRLNSTAAEVTSADAVDTDSTGIIVNQEATCNINVNGATYIYLAIA